YGSRVQSLVAARGCDRRRWKGWQLRSGTTSGGRLSTPLLRFRRFRWVAQGMAAEFAVDDQYCDDERTASDPGELGCRLALAQSAMDPVYILDKEYAA
ncbi:MAG: hypothetical protein ACRERS_09470, partial [Methylococcales bacterium]